VKGINLQPKVILDHRLYEGIFVLKLGTKILTFSFLISTTLMQKRKGREATSTLDEKRETTNYESKEDKEEE
jgi:hypothetical protein